jgi:predicted nucleotide-binding protein
VTLADNQKNAIEKLEHFKKLLQAWEDEDDNVPNIRSEINKNIPVIRELVKQANTFKTVTFSPPPITGGLLLRNRDLFNHIFEVPYGGTSIIPMLIDSIDEAIGVIEADSNFLNRPKDVNQNIAKKYESKEIFIVHGQDEKLKQAVEDFIKTLKLKPIILHKQENGGRTIIEKFEVASDVNFAIILMTPDDIGYPKEDENNKKGRARQNVVFEFGYFVGKLGRENIAVIVEGNIELPTDISGVVYINIDDHDWKISLAKEIRAAGFYIDLNNLIS